MPKSIGRRALLAFAAAALFQPALAAAQDYPSRPITIMVPLAAGTGMDALVRLYADNLQAALGKPVVVENRPGAALMLAAAAVAAAPADGYTLGVSTSAPIAIESGRVLSWTPNASHAGATRIQKPVASA